MRTVLFWSLLCSLISNAATAEPLGLQLRYRTETAPQSGRFHTLTREEQWPAEKTALILCDVWDTHGCHQAAMRVEELVERLNEVTEAARRQGVTIIHAPSSCMEFYQDHAARQRAMNAPQSASQPEEITKWCYQIPKEEQGAYPLDQSDGGCDDTPEEHSKWAAELTAMGRNARHPWIRQHAKIRIDEKRDYISDQGNEVWNILTAHGIDNVLIAGVHTNMCVLGRPFGLRQMVRNGKNAALIRDMTDTMYNPAIKLFVSHFTGTDLIVEHIEKWVCPTITSTQLIGGEEFRFAADKRPHLVVLCAEDEYKTETTLPPYALEELGKDYRVSFVFGSEDERGDVPGIAAISDADILLVSVRRRPLPSEQLKVVRAYVQAGNPVLGIRTASHAFCLRNKPAPEGLADWPEFDAEVFGGNYSNHYANNLQTTVHLAGESPLLNGLERHDFPSGGSLYVTSPLKPGATVVMTGTVEDKPAEPLAWTFQRADGGKSFYTSLGHVKDFEQPEFRQLLKNALQWLGEK